MIVTIEKPSNNITVTKQAVLRVKILEFNVPSGITNTVFTQKGSLLAGTGTGTYAEFPPGADGEFLQYDSNETSGLKSAKPTLEVEDTTNYAINGGFNFAQEQTPGTWTTIADGGYGPDQWKCYRENADLQYRRVDGSGVSGLTSPFCGEFKKITNAGKILICQPFVYLETVRFRGKTVSFQLKINSDAARTFKIAIIGLQAAGVANTIPAVVSAWNADGTDPTLGTNLAMITTPIACSVTTVHQVFSFSGTVPSDSKNLLLAVWSDADMPANATIGLAETGLFYGATLRSWTPIDDLSRVESFVEKSYNIDTAPGSASTPGALAFVASSTKFSEPVVFKTRKFKTPNMTFYSPVTGTSGAVRDSTAGADVTSVTDGGTTGESNSRAYKATGITSGNEHLFHWIAKAQL